MISKSATRVGTLGGTLLAFVLGSALLGACYDEPTAPTEPSAVVPADAPSAVRGMSACTPGADHATQGRGVVPDPVLAERCAARAGDLIWVSLNELLPTQPSLGYDEVYYKLGRYALGKDAINKRFADWCEANGQLDAAAADARSTLHDPTSFRCVLPVGGETDASRDVMKTVVIGPRGELWLTDGHHTFTSFWETPDGGPTTRVRVRVQGNLTGLSTADFWRAMQDSAWTWLYDANESPINPQQLPRTLGLAQFGDDPYRAALYFARDIGYTQEGSNATFQEFYWGRWIRGQSAPALQLGAYDRNDLTSYLALTRAIAEAIVALPDGAIVAGGYTAHDLGRSAAFNTSEFTKLSKPYANAKPGKIAYALEYRRTLGLLAAR